MFRKPKQNAEFEGEFVSIIPSRGEISYIASRHNTCSLIYEGKALSMDLLRTSSL